MDEQRGQKRTRRRRGSSGAIEEFVECAGPQAGARTLENDLMEAQRQMGLPEELPPMHGQTIAASLSSQSVAQGEGAEDNAMDWESGERRGKMTSSVQ